MDDERDEAPFWERREMVERFSGRDPDLRLQAMIAGLEDPGGFRVLDLGCAGGRNTIYLAGEGIDVIAVDGSDAMVTETRRRLADVIGPEAAAERVLKRRMDDLGGLEDGSVDLVVALGILHGAGSRAEWDAALSEVHRVLRPEGRILVSNHTDAFRAAGGEPLERLSGDDPIYMRRSGASFLIDADTLDREMESHGFVRLTETETKRVPTDGGGVRVTANGLYAKTG